LTLTVLIRRQRADEPAPGTLRAHVLQGGQKGWNLLRGRQLSDVESAQRAAERELFYRLRSSGATLEWVIDDASTVEKANHAGSAGSGSLL
jgi:hypothetical protein